MKKFYINNREIETVEKFLSKFGQNLFYYAGYVSEILDVKIDLISQELNNFIQLIREGGEYELNRANYKVK